MILKAKQIFTGESWLTDQAIILENNMISKILRVSDLPNGSLAAVSCEYMAPAFIDLQIYGAGEKLFAMYPETDSLFKLKEYCNKGGATNFLPTIATNETEVLFKAIDAVRAYWNMGGKGVLGIHVEGPWINRIRKGAHIESLIHEPSVEEVKKLLNYGKGVIKIITVAPEICSAEVLRLIQADGIIISAGHSNASYSEATNFFKSIPAATHLFNAMNPMHHREPGIAVAVMNHPTVMSSIVADGIHVSFEMISLAKKMLGERLFLITDAVTETTEGPYKHHFENDRYTSAGILSGSALTMMKAVNNLVNHCSISLSEALRMASLYPARLIQMDDKLGSIKVGNEANLVCFDKDLEVIHVS